MIAIIEKKAWILTTLSSFGKASKEAEERKKKKEEKNQPQVSNLLQEKQIIFKVLKSRYLGKLLFTLS